MKNTINLSLLPLSITLAVKKILCEDYAEKIWLKRKRGKNYGRLKILSENPTKKIKLARKTNTGKDLYM